MGPREPGSTLGASGWKHRPPAGTDGQWTGSGRTVGSNRQTPGFLGAAAPKLGCPGSFQKHLDLAIQLLPEEPFLYYLRGRYCYTVSHQLCWNLLSLPRVVPTLLGRESYRQLGGCPGVWPRPSSSALSGAGSPLLLSILFALCVPSMLQTHSHMLPDRHICICDCI